MFITLVDGFLRASVRHKDVNFEGHPGRLDEISDLLCDCVARPIASRHDMQIL